MSWQNAALDDDEETVMSVRERRAIEDRLDMLEEESEAYASKLADLMREVERIKKAGK